MLKWREVTFYMDDMEVIPDATDNDIGQATSNASQAVQLPKLEHLVIRIRVKATSLPGDAPSSRRLPAGVFSCAPKLWSLIIQVAYLPRDLIPRPTSGLPWHQLTSLKLHLNSFDLDSILNVMSTTRHLVHLDVHAHMYALSLPLPVTPRSSVIVLLSLVILSFQFRVSYARSEQSEQLASSFAHFFDALALPVLESAAVFFQTSSDVTGKDRNTITSSLASLFHRSKTTALLALDLCLDVRPQECLPRLAAQLVVSQRQMEYLRIGRSPSHARHLLIDEVLEGILSNDTRSALKVFAVQGDSVLMHNPQLLANVVVNRRSSLVFSHALGGLFYYSPHHDNFTRQLRDAAAMLEHAVTSERLDVRPANLLQRWQSESGPVLVDKATTKERISFSWGGTGLRLDHRTGILSWSVPS